jgi:hypothetical protein
MSDGKETLKALRAKVAEIRRTNCGVALSRAKVEDLHKELEYHGAATKAAETAARRKEALEKARLAREAAKSIKKEAPRGEKSVAAVKNETSQKKRTSKVKNEDK